MPQARAVAQIIQRVRPDILLLQEFDYDAAGESVAAFRTNYLGAATGWRAAIDFPYVFFTESNTGVPSGFDLNNDGKVEGGQDALGFGEFPGQYAMLLLSRFPIDAKKARTFRKFLWNDMPGARLPDDLQGARLVFDRRTGGAAAVFEEPLGCADAALARSRCMYWRVTPRRPPSTGPKIATVCAITTRSVSGPTIFRSGSAPGQIPAAALYKRRPGPRGGFGGGEFVVMGDQNSDPDGWRQPP